MKKMVLSLSLLLTGYSPISHALLCREAFNIPLTLKEEVIEASKLNTKPENADSGNYRPSVAEKFWLAKFEKIKTQSDALTLLQEIVGSINTLSPEAWKTVQKTALPIFLVKAEVLDNLGVLDFAAVKKYLDTQVARFENFNDPIYRNTMKEILNFPDQSRQYWTASIRTNINSVLNARENVTHNFKREFFGIAAEQLYNSLNVPQEQFKTGVFKKTIRTTDRSVIMEVVYDSKQNEHGVRIVADTSASSFNASQVQSYQLSFNDRHIKDNRMMVDIGAGHTLTKALEAPAVYSGRYGFMRQLTLTDNEGLVAAEVTTSTAPHNYGSNSHLEPIPAQILVIDIPKNPATYEAGHIPNSYNKAEGIADKNAAAKTRRTREANRSFLDKLFFD